MKLVLSMVVMVLLLAGPSWGVEGLVSVKSPYPVIQTMERLKVTVEKKGMTVFARIDHAKGAAAVGKVLRPTEVMLFGNPQGGTPFMECAQTVGIDLPLKPLAAIAASVVRP
jgi:uncharacterized protein (DUF302 family)